VGVALKQDDLVTPVNPGLDCVYWC